MNPLRQPIRPDGATVARMGVLAQPSLRFKSILVPVDFSKSSQKAFEYAASGGAVRRGDHAVACD
jgi:hypothetical protein